MTIKRYAKSSVNHVLRTTQQRNNNLLVYHQIGAAWIRYGRGAFHSGMTKIYSRRNISTPEAIALKINTHSNYWPSSIYGTKTATIVSGQKPTFIYKIISINFTSRSENRAEGKCTQPTNQTAKIEIGFEWKGISFIDMIFVCVRSTDT